MPTVLKAVFLLAFASMFIVYPLYFVELSAFGKLIRSEHPALEVKGNYLSLMRVSNGELDGVKLSAAALKAGALAKRWLYVGMSLFSVVLLVGLADSI